MDKNKELRVGMLVLIAIVLAAFWLLFLKEFKFKQPSYPLYAVFEQASGITAGAPVEVQGVVRGKVREIQLRRDEVLLSLEVEEGTFISSDARFVIQPDIVGPTSVAITQGSSDEALSAGTEVRGQALREISEILEDAAGLTSGLEDLVASLNTLAGGGALDSIFADLAAGSRQLRELAEDKSTEISSILDEWEGLARDARSLLAESREPLRLGLDGAVRLSARADSLALTLETLGTQFGDLGQKLEDGEGTLGRLLQDDEVYLSLKSSVNGLDSLLTDIRANPKKYFKIEVF